MPKHYAVDENILSGSVHFEGVKTAQVSFVKTDGSPVSFTVAPRVQLTLLNASSQVPYRVSNVKTGNLYTGIVIGFQSPVTIDVEWQVVERA